MRQLYRTLLVSALAGLLACGPTSYARSRQPAPTGRNLSVRQPGDDPRAWFWEELNSQRIQGEIRNLKVGECILQYRRPNGYYTPVAYHLRYTRPPDASKDLGVRVMYVLHRGEDISVRATCRMPTDREMMDTAYAALKRRMSRPAITFRADGTMRLFGPEEGDEVEDAKKPPRP